MTHLEEKLKKQLREAKGELSMRRPLDTMDEIAYKELEKENGDLRTSIGHRIERVEELNAITRKHQTMNGKMHSEIEILKKELKTEKLDREYDKSVHTQEIEDLTRGKLKK